MRNIIVVFIVLLFSGIWLSSAGASIARGGGGARPQVGNRSAGFSSANVDRGNINRNVAGGSVDRSTAAGSVNRNVTDVNRNVNDVNVNRNVNRNVDVHGWGNNYWVDDNHWNWGSFATGAAVGATGAAIGATAAGAAAAAPAMGTVVTTLPPACAPVPGTALYDCSGAYYQPSYEGSNLVYQVVQHP